MNVIAALFRGEPLLPTRQEPVVETDTEGHEISHVHNFSIPVEWKTENKNMNNNAFVNSTTLTYVSKLRCPCGHEMHRA